MNGNGFYDKIKETEFYMGGGEGYYYLYNQDGVELVCIDSWDEQFRISEIGFLELSDDEKSDFINLVIEYFYPEKEMK